MTTLSAVTSTLCWLKLIVTGARTVSRLCSVLAVPPAELTIEGMLPVIPFHRVVLDDPAFAPAEGGEFKLHTRWIETEFNNTIPCTPVHPVAWTPTRTSAPPWWLRSTVNAFGGVLPDLGGGVSSAQPQRPRPVSRLDVARQRVAAMS